LVCKYFKKIYIIAKKWHPSRSHLVSLAASVWKERYMTTRTAAAKETRSHLK